MQTISGADYELEYLFIAEKMDGSIYKQTPRDIAKYSDWGSAFTDVVNEKLRRFSLVGKGHIYTVDLKDGHIEIDGRKICPPKDVPACVELKLIYWRQVKKSIVQNGKQLPTQVKYIIGWEYNFRGKHTDWQLAIE